jgi:hypothetical protein
MEEFINLDFRNILHKIGKLNPQLRYAACLKFLDLVRPYFCKFVLMPSKKFFFRVRAHPYDLEDHYFTNISELSFRTDLFNIINYGRCNCPFETTFYCSDHPLLALCEVSKLIWKECERKPKYYTTSIWKVKEPLNITPIFENMKTGYRNQKMLDVTWNCFTAIEQLKNYGKKNQLKEIHSLMGKEFTKPFTKQSNSYLISSALSNYLLANKHEQSERIDGLTYSTCLNIGSICNLGFNYVFNPLIIGFERKIEFHGAFRSKIEKLEDNVRETERKFFKKANCYTGEIIW